MLNLKVDAFNRETVDSAINLAVESLELLGHSQQDAPRAGKLFRDHDRASVAQLAELWGDDASNGGAERQRMEDLKQVQENGPIHHSKIIMDRTALLFELPTEKPKET